MFHTQITAASALTNLTTPTRTGPPHQPMMSPRTAWRRALQERGNRIPAVQKSIIIGYIFKDFASNHIYNRQYVCKKPDKNHGGAAVKNPFETYGCKNTTKSVAKCWPGWTHQGSSCYFLDTTAVIKITIIIYYTHFCLIRAYFHRKHGMLLEKECNQY